METDDIKNNFALVVSWFLAISVGLGSHLRCCVGVLLSCRAQGFVQHPRMGSPGTFPHDRA